MFGGERQPDVRVLGLHRMIDALIVLQVLKIPDTEGFPIFFSTSCGYGREAKGSREGGIGSSSEAESINRHVSHNSAITIHCSPMEHVEDMNSWYPL